MPSLPRPHINILVIASDPVGHGLVTGALGLAHAFKPSVRSATSVHGACEVLESWTPACVLLDLPRDECRAAVHALQDAAPGVASVVLIDDEDEAHIHDLIASGAQDVVQKTFLGPRLLEQSVRYAIDRSAWVQQLASKNRELEARNARLQDVASVTSHDLKAPLRAMHRLLEEAAGAADPTVVARKLDAAMARVARLYDMIDELLAAALVAPDEWTSFDPQDVLRDVLDRLQVPSGFVVSLPSDAPLLHGDPIDLGHVFQNLITNAVQHHDRVAGHIRITVRTLGHAAEFSVEDDGPGFGAPVSMPTAGHGLGLLQVRRVVESYGGDFHIGRAPGGGVRVRFTWPLPEVIEHAVV